MEIDLTKSPHLKITDFVPDAQILYHYTSIEALFGGIIVRQPQTDKEICLWMSNCQYMNDPEELNTGIRFASDILNISPDILEKHASEYQQIKDNLYITSFSAASDCLPMWAMYGKNGNGIALGFNKEIIEATVPSLYKCVYVTESNKARLQSEISALIENADPKDIENLPDSAGKIFIQMFANIVNSLAFYIVSCFYCKNPAYIYEQEIRSVLLTEKSAKYRINNNLIIPYIEQYFPKSALKEIWIGPTNDMNRATYSLRKYLDHMGFNEVEIKQSQVPYRI
ncbi:MAG: DUF2971 domain-containing protein [Alistipes shahii]